MRASALTWSGLVRETNEDAYLKAEDIGLFAVADGMGGHRAGEVASRMAIEAIEEFMRAPAGSNGFAGADDRVAGLSDEASRLRAAHVAANARVHGAANEHADRAGMGTTIVSAWVLERERRLVVCHAGDSRLYLFARGELTQLTRDDSFLEFALDSAEFPDVQAIANHPDRRTLVNALGVRSEVDIHVDERPITGPGVLLLCTDGLHGSVDHDAMESVLGAYDIERAGAELVRAAHAGGGRDNVTVLLVALDAPGAES